MPYQLNRRAFERLKSMVRAGLYTPKAFKFTPADSNALLGAGNWTEFGNWFLGTDDQQPKQSKDHYAYPYGKSGTVYLEALKQTIKAANKAGDRPIADAAGEVLEMAKQKDQDAAKAGRKTSAIAFRSAVQIAAAAAAEKGQPAKPPTFAMTAYTGGPMCLEGWEHPVVVELDGIDVTDKPRPALRDHDPCLVVGHTTAITADAGRLLASGIVSGSGAHVDELVDSSAKGFPWQASIGASVIQNDFIPQGQQGQANGQTFDGPINIARRTSLGEISFVALGADDDTSARIAAKAAAKGTAMDFDAWLAAKGFKAEDLTGTQLDGMKASYQAESDTNAAKAAAAKKDDDDEEDEDEDEEEDDDKPAKKAKAKATAGKRRQIQAARDASRDVVAEDRKRLSAERKRVGVITAALDSYRPKVEAKKFAEIEAAAIAEGWDGDKTELALIRAARPDAPKNFSINSGAGAEVTPDIIAAACAVSGGVAEKYAFKGLSDKQKEIASSKPLRHQTIFGLCAVIAAANGVPLTQHRMSDDVIRHMFELDASRRLNIRADGGGGAGGYSTLSLSGITENILNKSMLQAYATIESVVEQICYQTDTNDFKQFKRYRLTASGDFQPVGASGELKNMALQDESYSNQVSTVGTLVNITRNILINDDMGALTDIPTVIGRKAALAREKAVFTVYFTLKSLVATGASVGQAANSFNFVSTGAKNYLTGGSSALSITSMASGRQKFVEQKDANGDPIMVLPDRVLVSPALETPADNLFQGANIVVNALGSTSAKGTEPNLNAHRNKYKPIVSPYLGANSPIASAAATDTQWSLLANPDGGMAPIQVGYLRGQRTPIIERGEGNFNTLGISMRAFYDFGVAAHDWRCLVWSDGQ